VSKDYRRFRLPAESAQRLKSDFKDLAHPRRFEKLAQPEFEPAPKPEPEPEPKLEPEQRIPIRHKIIQDIVRRCYPPDGKVPQKVSVAALKREVIDKMWEATCNSEAWRDACKQHGINPKKPPDANTIARAIGRRVA
jgi:hypothetical protein